MHRAWLGLLTAQALSLWGARVAAQPAGASTPVASPQAPTPVGTATPTMILPDKPAPSGPSRPVLTLAQAERFAAERQPQVLAAKANTAIAAGLADQARSGLFPQVLGQASYTRETGNFVLRPGSTTTTGTGTVIPVGGSIFSSSYDYWSFALTGTQLIYDFGYTLERGRAADLSTDAYRVTERATKLTVTETVRTAYFGARAMKELVDVARESLSDQNKHLAQAQGYVQAGTQPPITLATQKAAVANAVVASIQAQNNYETAKAQLNQAAGIVGGTEYDVSDETLPPIDDEDLTAGALEAKAISARPEIAAYQKQRESQQATLSSARGSLGPSLSANGAISEVGLELNQLVPNWSAGVLLNWPIFQGGLSKGMIRQAEAGLDSVDAQRELEVLLVRFQVTSAWLAVRAAKATIGAADDALASAKEQLRLAEQRFVTGVGNIIELSDAQVAFTTAAAQVVQAKFGLATARAQLLAALGRP